MQTIYHVAHLGSMMLSRTEYQGLFHGVYQTHKFLHTGFVTLANLDVTLVEILFRIGLEHIHLATHHCIIGGVVIIVDGTLHVDVTERRQETIVNTLLQGIFISMVCKVTVGIGILVYTRSSGQA